MTEISMRKCCILTTLGDDPHTQGLYKASRIAQMAGIEVHILSPGTEDKEIMDLIYQENPDFIGLSYRLSPQVGVQEFTHFLNLLDCTGLLQKADGEPRKVALAGLPETIRSIERNKSNFPCNLFTIQQDNDLMQRANRVLQFFDVSDSLRPTILEELKSELYPPKLPELDELARFVIGEDSHLTESPLPIHSIKARRSLTQRIRESDIPILRTHFGVPDESIKPTVEGIKKLAEARVIDEISLGSSDLSQRYFGKPEEFANRKNDGGVPYKTADHLVELVDATQRGNFPSIKPYAHVVDLVGFIDTCIKAGMLIGAHQAIPLYWFNELDGRGSKTVSESIGEHIAAVKRLAQLGIPVEMNDPNQWSSRWAHDTIVTTDYGLITSVMLNAGVRDIVLQLQFNKPRETGDLADLAKMTASLRLANELLPKKQDRPTIWRETRTGIGYLDPDPARAKFQLARSTFLQMMISPHIIHVVSYCEADHAARVEDIVESSKLVRRCAKVFKQYEPELIKCLNDPEVVARREYLLKESRYLLKRIAHLNQSGSSVNGIPLRLLVHHLADERTLLEALRRGYMAAPGIFHSAYPTGRRFTTSPTRNGFIDCINPNTGFAMSERDRISLLHSWEY